MASYIKSLKDNRGNIIVPRTTAKVSTYDNTASQLAATNAQDAIDELSFKMIKTVAGVSPDDSGNVPLTAADVGAAPDGYGLGDKNAKTAVTDLNIATANGWYNSNGENTLNAPVFGGIEFKYGWLFVTTGYYTRQDYYTNTLDPIHCVRYYVDFKWTPWEVENPPMQIGVEYRTTERWNGKPVYVRYVNFGSAPNATTKSVSHGIENFSQCAGWTGILGGANLQGHSGITAVDINATSIAITTGKDLSASAVYVAVKYTKLTD